MSCFLMYGSKGDSRITKLERKLKSLGYYKGVIEADKGKTPYYGPLLTKAVQNYQRKKGLQVDCVGPITWNSLFPSNKVSTTVTKVVSKVPTSTIYQQGKDALGGDFTSITGILKLLKQKGVSWTNYQDDRYSFSAEAARFKNHLPANCSDLSQFVYMLGKSLKKYTVLKFVHLWCPKSGGHIILEAKGGEFTTLTWIDVSAILKSGYKIGSGWCFTGPNKPTGSVISRDDPWLLSDDGVT